MLELTELTVDGDEALLFIKMEGLKLALDYIQLKEARKSSFKSFIISIVAILISVVTFFVGFFSNC